MRSTGSTQRASRKDVLSLEYATAEMDDVQLDMAAESPAVYETEEAAEQMIKRLETEMKAAAKELEFERAAALRNRIRALKMKELELRQQCKAPQGLSESQVYRHVIRAYTDRSKKHPEEAEKVDF